MERRRRTKILIETETDLAKEMAMAISQQYTIKEIQPPRQGLTMIKIRETAKNSLFYIGEVLVTEAKVDIDGTIGIGLVIGIEEELSNHFAIIDAAYARCLPETKDWEKKLLLADEKIQEKQRKKQADLMKTKVAFETMQVD